MKNCERGLEMFHFQARGHSFSLYGTTLSRHITHLLFPALNWFTSGFVCKVTLSLNWLTCRRSIEPFVRNLKSERESNSATRHTKMYSVLKNRSVSNYFMYLDLQSFLLV